MPKRALRLNLRTAYALKIPMEPIPRQMSHVHVPRALKILRHLLVPNLKVIAVVWLTFMEMPEPLMAHAKLALITVPLLLSHPLLPLQVLAAHVQPANMEIMQQQQLVARRALEEPLPEEL